MPHAAGLLLAACLMGCGPLALDRSVGDSSTSTASSVRAETSTGEIGEGGTVAVVIEGRSITLDEIHERMQDQFLEEFLQQPEAKVYEMQETAVRGLVRRHILDRAAAERGVSAEALSLEITEGIAKPTVQEVADWYAANQPRLRGAQLEDIADRIEALLADEAKKKAWSDFLGPKIEALDWRLMLEPPRTQLTATRLIRGPTEAPVTIMAFSDYQCPYCIRSEPVLAEVLARYPESVRLVHRHFPLDNIHSFARPASEAAMCAEEQGKFWEFHDAIFARQGRLEESSFAEIGDELGLDQKALGTCIEARRYADFVQSDFTAGQRAGVTGTPAFFVNGIPLEGARDADALSRVVDAELKRIEAN